MDPFTVFSIHELALVVEYLSPEDVVRLQCVSRGWREVLNSNFISKIAFLQHFSWSCELFEYCRLLESVNSEVIEKEKTGYSGTGVPSNIDYDFIIAFRKALRRRMGLRNAEPRRIHDLVVSAGPVKWAVSNSNEPCYFAWVSTRKSALPTNDPVPTASPAAFHPESHQPNELVAEGPGRDPVFPAFSWDQFPLNDLSIVCPDGSQIGAAIQTPDFSDTIAILGQKQPGKCKLEVLEIKIMSKVVVVRSKGLIDGPGNYDGDTSGIVGIASVFHAFSTETGTILWEKCFPFHKSTYFLQDPIPEGYFDLVNDKGHGRLVYLYKHGGCDRDGGVSVNWVDLQTGVDISKKSLDIGIINDKGWDEGSGEFTPFDPLWRDVKMSKDGRYLVTVALDMQEFPTLNAPQPDYPVNYSRDFCGAAPRGAARTLDGRINGYIEKPDLRSLTTLRDIWDRTYKVHIHDLKTGRLVQHYKLERPREPNIGISKAEFSPKIHFSVTGDLVYLVEESYMYSPNGCDLAYHTDIDRRERSTVNSYGWTIDLQRSPIDFRCVKRTRYTSHLRSDENNRISTVDPSRSCMITMIPAPYRIETFFPGEDVSVIRYASQGGSTSINICGYSIGNYEPSQDGMEESVATMEFRRTVMGSVKREHGEAWKLPPMQLNSSSGEWEGQLFVINERYLGSFCHDTYREKRALVILDFCG